MLKNRKAFFILLAFFSVFLKANFVSADDAQISVFAVILPAPAGLAAVALSSSQINLSWTAVSGATSYNVYKSGELIASVETNSYSATSLSAGTLYSFTVSAVGDGESSRSSAATATTLQAEQTGPVSGGGGGLYYNLIIPAQKKDLSAPAGGFKIIINNGALKTNSPAVSLQLDGGPDAKEVEIANDENFLTGIKAKYSQSKAWVLAKGDGQKTVYTRFISAEGASTKTFSSNIILDTSAPEITAVPLNNLFGVEDEVVLNGNAAGAVEVILSWGQQYGATTVREDSSWSANLGRMEEGSHLVIITAKDDADNLKTIALDIEIKGRAKEVPPEESRGFAPFVFKNIGEKIKSWARWGGDEQEYPERIIIVSKTAPKVLGGAWNLLPVKPLN